MYNRRLIRKGENGLGFLPGQSRGLSTSVALQTLDPSQIKQTVNLPTSNGNSFNLSGAGMALGGAAAGMLNSLGSGHLTDAQSTIRGLGYSALSTINPVVGMAAQAFDGLFGMMGLGLDTIDEASADRFNIDQTGTNIVNSIPVIGSIAGLFGGGTDTAYKSQETQDLASSYGNSLGDINAAMNLSDKRMLFGRSKANNAIAEANRQNRLITQIGREATKYKNNSFGNVQAIANQNIYSGYTPGLALARKGRKLPNLENARYLLNKFQNGGVISKNVIPEGSLHKNKHHLEDVNPELEGQITEKGIPVIINDGDEIKQCAEIEQNEIVFQKSVTEQLDEYFEKYNETNDENIAIECGKFLVNQILKNTVDNTGLLKEVK